MFEELNHKNNLLDSFDRRIIWQKPVIEQLSIKNTLNDPIDCRSAGKLDSGPETLGETSISCTPLS
jgi:hypothetical protein